jgi:GNAT superfamily N-acetyltransferase
MAADGLAGWRICAGSHRYPQAMAGTDDHGNGIRRLGVRPGHPTTQDDGQVEEARIRGRRPVDLERCVSALAEVHRVDGYPLNWPSDPYRWLSPPGVLAAWIAETADAAVVGHVAVHSVDASPPRQSSAIVAAEISRLFVVSAARRQAVATRLLEQTRQWAARKQYELTLEVVDDQRSAATALYEHTGWRHIDTTTANWTAPDGGSVKLRRYALGPNADHIT